ncbi:permease-like cell division protein FtsX [Skermania piniformis]|uniref:Cell division protein FtsX n=1 Tax=Skermania pinensis TaxID=39122 RepID=A0ABX8S6F1_9ACTN|nr:permease-like cell division protein FtsX [Skermania piniformis]QXQ12831.1 permease-like cell division protein FtsX [Skermania piniformis]
MRAGFVVGEVLTGLRRNLTITIAMVLTTGISLALLGGGLLVVQMADRTQQMFLDRVEVQIYLTSDISDVDPNCAQDVCKGLRADLEHTPGVQTVQYLSRSDALQDARDRTFKNMPEYADLISENALPASFKVKMSDAEQYSAIYDAFDSRPGVAGILNQKELVDRLVSVFTGLRNAAFALAVVQAFAALLLIANMVQIAAFTRRTEVGIMRLVGATRWFTQLPFLLEAVVAALAGSILAVIGMFVAKPLLIDGVLGDLYDVNVFAKITTGDIMLISPLLVLVGVAFAAVTAYLTLRLYVRE